MNAAGDVAVFTGTEASEWAGHETGEQIAVFGRRGSRPLNLEEMQRLYLDEQGNPWYVDDE